MDIGWKIGVEIELLAPPGRSRLDLAQAIAQACGGQVRTVLHQDSEPSKVPGRPVFSNLTPGFEVLDAAGAVRARCVDDLTLQDDLDKRAAPKPGWWRVVGDDERILRMLALAIDPALPLPAALERLPALCNGRIEAAAAGMYRLSDALAAPLAIAAPLPGERERPCELITAPLQAAHAAQLDALLALARGLDFRIPREGATHLHFDAAALCSAHAVVNLVQVFTAFGPVLRQWCATPSSFRRVGGWPPALRETVLAPDFRHLDWPTAQARVRALEPSKFCDFNLKNLAYGRADRHTFEVRILPATLDTQQIVDWMALFEAVLRQCIDPGFRLAQEASPSALEWLAGLPLSAPMRARWQGYAALAAAVASG